MEGVISGHKFSDNNGDGDWDTDEPALEGWQINLLDSTGSVFRSVYTGSGGKYTFTNIPPGSYKVAETQQPDYQQTCPTNPDYYNVTIGNGITWTGSVDGVVYGGPNSFNYSKNLICGGDTTVLVDVYGVSAGKYTFKADTSIQNLSGTLIGNDIINDPTITVEDETGAPDNLDFGNYLLPPDTKISGYKFHDLNNNGVWEQSEPALDDWTIRLYDAENTKIDEVKTGEGDWPLGYYEFKDLYYGEYRVEEVQKTNWDQTYPRADMTSTGLPFNVTVNSDLTYDVSISSDSMVTDDLDFGNYYNPPHDEHGSISGHKFNDSNRNGKYDPGEYRLDGWVIRLYDAENTKIDEVTTGEGDWPLGYYEFTNLPYGDYKVEELQKPNWNQTYPRKDLTSTELPFNVTVNSDLTYKVIISSDSKVTENLDFGNYKPGGGGDPDGSISGYKFNDLNGNGQWDKETEPALKDWTIKLSNGYTTKTDSNGFYSFTTLSYGTYKVEEVQQDGWTQTAPQEGSYTRTIDSSKEDHTNLNFGNWQGSGGNGSISGHKFNDRNGDGKWDKTTEPALREWTIKLSNGQTTKTDNNGFYSFSNLAYGKYIVEEVEQYGWTQTAPARGIFEVTLNSANPTASDLDFGNQPSTIIIPPTGTPDETITVYPTAVPAGDPTITVKAGPDTKQVYAILPDGKRLNLKEKKPGVWTVSFMVPFGTPDGPYKINVFLVNNEGKERQGSYTITIDNSLPLMNIKQEATADGEYILKVKPLFNAVSMKYSVSGAADVSLTRQPGSSWWIAVVPAGSGSIIAIDESGYEVIQNMTLAIVKAAQKPEVMQAIPAISKAVKGLAADQEHLSKGAARGSYGLYAVIAVFLLIAGGLFAGRTKLRTK